MDLRQLGNVLYTKRKSRPKADINHKNIIGLGSGDEQDFVSTKRVRKERVVMVDGKGTGYGGAVPVLAETMAPERSPRDSSPRGGEEGAGGSPRSRGRQWEHQTYCALCGKVSGFQ